MAKMSAMYLKHYLVLLPMLLVSSYAMANNDTVSVFFRSNESTLTEGMQQQLDNAIYNDAISFKDPLWLIGYADEVGNAAGNLRLSKARAATVKAYLIRSGYRPDKITLVTGKGNEAALRTAEGKGYPRDRRVDIVKAPAAPEPEVVVASPPPPPPVVIPPPPPPKPVAPPINLGKMKKGESIALSIYFAAGRHMFRTGAKEVLETLHQSLTDNPSVRIKIEGHVCCTPVEDVDGEDLDTHTFDLSVNRAKAVRDYLIERGIAANRLEYEGFGGKRPVVTPERTEDDAMRNRRVEVRVIE